MKQTYIKPQTEIVEVDTETLMLGLSGETGGLGGTGTGGGMSGGSADANGRRGEWGNLWAQD